MKDFIEQKILPPLMTFVNSVPITAIKEGFLVTMPLTIIGSVFLLLARFPYLPVQEYFENIGITPILLQANNATFNIVALVAVFSIAYFYAKLKGVEPINSGILGLVVYLLLIVYEVTTESGEIITNVISLDYFGARGMVAAIIIGLIVGQIFSWFVSNNITIRMPASVPAGVANSFIAIIPGVVIVAGAAILFGILRYFDTSFIDSIYEIIQIPLQGMTSSLGGVIFMALAQNFLWWFGIHGASIVSGIMSGVLIANMDLNQTILDAGQFLTSENGQIVTYNFRALIIILTGSGITIGLVLYFLFFAKSEQLKSLGKITSVSTIFNINEPVLFGTPVVLNPILFIPFILVPIISSVVAYLAMDWGLVPLMGAINPPWTTPPIISGLITGGWRLAALQIVVMIISFVGYFPFIRKYDDILYKEEQEKLSEIKEELSEVN